jgi:ATP-dependent helicase HrpA
MREWCDIHHQISDLLVEYGLRKAQGARRKADGGSRNAEGGLRPLRAVGSNYEPEAVGVKGAHAPEGRRPQTHRELRQRPGGKVEMGLRNDANSESDIGNSTYERIHRSVLSGFLSNIAQKKENNIYRAAKGREVMIFPGSGLFNKAKNWIVAEEMMETSRLFARTVANIGSDWLEDLGGDLCQRTYLDPHWEKNRGEVVASEQVSLFGLVIVPDRKVSYGKVNPIEASHLFIQQALINADLKKPFAFMKYNQGLIDEVKDIENRFRRRDLLVDEHTLFEFYQEKLPGIYDIRSLSKYLKRVGNDRFLRIQKETLLRYQPNDDELIQYPTRLDINRHVFECSYRFDPGKNDDGVTVNVPSALAQSVSPNSMDWLVPGLYPEKIEMLIKGLPKAHRKKLVPIKNTVDIIVREMPQCQSSLVSALGDFIFRRFGVDIPATAWSTDSLPDYLKMRISITAPDGKVLRAGRDAALLRGDVGGRVNSVEFEMARRTWEKKGIRRWDFGDLPEFVSDSGKRRASWVAYPALETDSATPKTVGLRLFRRQDKALAAHRAGVAALYEIHFAKTLKFLKRQLTLPPDVRSTADYFGGAKKLEKRLYDRVIKELFAKNLRSEAAFQAHADSVAAKIFPAGQELLDKTIPVLTAYHMARSQVYDLQQANRTNRMAVSFLEDLIRELERLVSQNFVAIYEIRRLDHLPRYIQAAAIRARRAMVDFEKDRAKSKEIIKFSDGLNLLLKELSPTVSDEKRQAIEAYFWLVEEYKVSVFAQELKTSVPISAKRLEQKLKEIGRMV